jgi:hypothetical protein
MSRIAPLDKDIEMVETDRLSSNEENSKVKKSDLTYSIDDVPPWYLSLFLGFQVV